MIKAAIYTRVSTGDQVSDEITIRSSLELQEQSAQQYALLRHWQVLPTYREEGVSGEKFEERKQLQALLKDAQNGKFQAVIVANGDRLARAIHIYTGIIYELEYQLKIPVIDLSQPLEVDPLDFDPRKDDTRFLMQNLKGMFADLDQRTRTKRLRDGKQAQIRAGRAINSIYPYGYTHAYREVKGRLERYPVPDPVQYPVLQMLPDLILNRHMSQKAICRYLNGLGIPAKNGGGWNHSSIYQMVHNPFYCGYLPAIGDVRNGSTRNRLVNEAYDKGILPRHNYEHPFTKETFEAMRERLKAREARPRTNASPNPLSGILYCAYCGGAMSFRRNYPKEGWQIFYYFNCSNATSASKPCKTPEGRYNIAPIKFVMDKVLDRLDYLANLYQQDMVSFSQLINGNDNSEELAELKTKEKFFSDQLAEIPARLDRVLDGWERNLIDDDEYTARKAKIKKEETGLKEELATLKLKKATLTDQQELLLRADKLFRDWVRPASDFTKWDEQEIKNFRQIVGGFIKKIRIGIKNTSENSRKPQHELTILSFSY